MYCRGTVELAMTKQTALESNVICGTKAVLHSAWLECTLLDVLAHKSNNGLPLLQGSTLFALQVLLKVL